MEEFSQEIKEHVLPTEKDVFGHYYPVWNWPMCTIEKYLKRRPECTVCKEKVLKNESVWRKSNLLIINKKSMETKLKKLIKQYTVAKAKRPECNCFI